jgi:hypothetical protein
MANEGVIWMPARALAAAANPYDPPPIPAEPPRRSLGAAAFAASDASRGLRVGVRDQLQCGFEQTRGFAHRLERADPIT